jgi:cytochrome d ubiquinol oxidase subunit I
MVGLGLLMLFISWFGCWLQWRGRIEQTPWFLRLTFLAFPSGFVAVIAGWFTAEVGRQPWVVYGLLRTAEAHTPTLTTADVLTTLVAYVLVYAVIFLFGTYYLYKLLRDGPAPEGPPEPDLESATALRPMARGGDAESITGSGYGKGG